MLEHEHIYLDALPSAQMYERSYMHRDVVTHVLTAQEQDFIITGSADGHLKFWKKKGEGIEFAKHFRAHMEAVAGLFCHVTLHTSWGHGWKPSWPASTRTLSQVSTPEPGGGRGYHRPFGRIFARWQASWLLT